MTLLVETVTEPSRLASIRDEWERVNLACEEGSYFSSHDWLMTWCNCFLTPETSLYVLLVWRAETLLAIAPFVIRLETGGIKWLYLLGTGEEESSEVATEYADLLVLSEVRSEAERLLAEKLQKDNAVWDAARLLNVRADSRIVPVLSAALRKGWSKKYLAGVRYSVALEKYLSSEEYLASLQSESFRKKLKVAQRRMQKAGGEFAVVGNVSSDFHTAHANLMQLHNKRWKSKGCVGVFADELFARFHYGLVATPGAKDSIRLAVLAMDGVPVAVLYLLLYRGECHFYQSGIDSTVRPNVSPGILAHYLAIEWAIAQGCRTYDFMKGGVSRSYKRDFCSPGIQLYNYTLLRPLLHVKLRYLGVLAVQLTGRVVARFGRRYPG